MQIASRGRADEADGSDHRATAQGHRLYAVARSLDSESRGRWATSSGLVKLEHILCASDWQRRIARGQAEAAALFTGDLSRKNVCLGRHATRVRPSGRPKLTSLNFGVAFGDTQGVDIPAHSVNTRSRDLC